MTRLRKDFPRIAVQFLIADGRDPRREQIRIEGGLARHHQDFTRRRINRNGSTDLVAESRFCRALQIEIERCAKIVSTDRVLRNPDCSTSR